MCIRDRLEGDATEILRELEGTYDVIFMDAAKGQYIHFLPDILRPVSYTHLLPVSWYTPETSR